MTYKLVPLDCHHRNIAKQAIETFKTILSPSSAELTIDFPSPCGAISCNQRNSLSTSYDRATSHQKCSCMPMSMGNTITWNACLDLWNAQWWPMSSPRTDDPGTFMHTPVSTLGWQWSITNASTSTSWKPGQQESVTQCSSNTNILQTHWSHLKHSL